MLLGSKSCTTPSRPVCLALIESSRVIAKKLTTDQDEADEDALAKLQAMDAETTRFREETASLKNEEKELRLALREGTSQVPVTDLRIAVAALEQEQAEISARLAKLKSGHVKPVSIEERGKVNADHRRWQKAASVRRKIRGDVWDAITDQLEKKDYEEVKERLGLEF